MQRAPGGRCGPSLQRDCARRRCERLWGRPAGVSEGGWASPTPGGEEDRDFQTWPPGGARSQRVAGQEGSLSTGPRRLAQEKLSCGFHLCKSEIMIKKKKERKKKLQRLSSSGLHLARPPLPRSGRTQSETSERRNSTPHSATQSASPVFSYIRVITLSESNLTLSFPLFPLCRLCSVVTARRAVKNIECCDSFFF